VIDIAQLETHIIVFQRSHHLLWARWSAQTRKILNSIVVVDFGVVISPDVSLLCFLLRLIVELPVQLACEDREEDEQ